MKLPKSPNINFLGKWISHFKKPQCITAREIMKLSKSFNHFFWERGHAIITSYDAFQHDTNS